MISIGDSCADELVVLVVFEILIVNQVQHDVDSVTCSTSSLLLKVQ